VRRTITAFIAAAVTLTGWADADEPRHLEDAIAEQQRLVSHRTNDAGAYNDLGNLLELDENFEAAEEAYRQALMIDPSYTAALYNLGLLLQQTGETKEAREALESVLELEPDHAWGHFQMGMILDGKKKFDRAAHHFTRAFVLEPELLEIGSNPQLLDTRLATVARAALQAYAQRMERLEAAPRQYNQPDRITLLLVPEAGGSAGAQPPTADSGSAAEPAVSPEEIDPVKAARAEERRRQRRLERLKQESQSDSDEENDG
jgi:tetratricopeptide (TPR) repeat protein